jgi:hypothetical protein
MQDLSESVRELTPSELASVAGGVAFAAGGTNTASVTFAPGGAVVFFGNGNLNAILGNLGWNANAT